MQRNNKTGPVLNKANRQIWPALVAVGGIAAGPAVALELGEIRIDSSLGQPLRASIAYALHAGEQIHESCIFLRPVRGASGIPGVGKPRISLTDSAILLRGLTPLREPLVAMQVAVQCPKTANLAREYTLMVDLPSPASGIRVVLNTESVPLATVPMPTASTRNVVVTPASTKVAPREVAPVSATTPKAPAVDKSPIAAGFRYQVQAGDSLSQIVSRVEHRAIALWPAVDAVFAANPHAFLNNDRDLLRAGAWLAIPDMSGASAAIPVEASAPLDAAAPVVNAMPAAPAELPLELTVEPAEDFVSPTGDADVAIDTPETVVVDIPDTVVEITPVAPLAADIKSTDTGATESWSRWLGGAGLTILFAVLIFGRQIRDRFGSTAIGKSAVRPTRRKQAVAPRPLMAAASDEAYNVSITAENFRQVAEDSTATVKDLQSLQVEEVGNSRFSFISDFERQIFEQNFNAAIAAAGYASMGIPEIAQDAEATGDDFADRKARASSAFPV